MPFTTTSQTTRKESLGPLSGLAEPQRHHYGPPPLIPWAATRGAINNLMAGAEQAATRRPFAGQGISSGRGQDYLRKIGLATARAQAGGEAEKIAMQDQYANAATQQEYRTAKADEDRAFEKLNRTFMQRNGLVSDLFGRTGRM